jgi:SAM-dependent methyltransferase
MAEYAAMSSADTAPPAATPDAADAATGSPACLACGAALDARAHHAAEKDGYAILRCPACATLTVHPFPSAAELSAFYGTYRGTPDYLAKRDAKIARARGEVRRLMRGAPGRRFLDVGCNAGFAVAAAQSLGLEARGIDLDPNAIAAAREAFGADHFTVARVEELATAGERADMIFTSEVIEHTTDPHGFLAALARILVPGGRLFLTTPDAGHFRVPRDLTRWNAVTPPEHLVLFTRKAMRAMLARHGFAGVRFNIATKPGIRLYATRV